MRGIFAGQGYFIYFDHKKKYALKKPARQPHPTLLLLHGFPGNEKNLDIAQALRKHGWNVIYFDYRGSWGSQGNFSFRHCVEDVENVVGFCKRYADSLHIDTSNIALFGHSMGGWICLQALRRLPEIKKGFACSAWDLGAEITSIRTYNKAGFMYEVWKTDHPFTNKRQALTRAVIAFLDK